MAGTGDAYRTVLEYARRLHALEQTDHLLRWDSDVMMPPGGSPARSRQRATLSKLLHDLRSADELGGGPLGRPRRRRGARPRGPLRPRPRLARRAHPRHGQRCRTRELVERAMGEPHTAEPFLDFVE